ncbi:ABC transporter ATP-binding protein [Paenibacillus oralis]|uniref:ABC transporter ATP-binding protein n=1 Tax=Paenibacillus oralis TaxID=2490856 RepID=A0A3P3U166_9BACL|nr:ABC transporter ATP-binding protein [Paenibacillus oralis]RRJ64095.1 ABC transporter ATP-binding protein [Paenibacillus oralis]
MNITQNVVRTHFFAIRNHLSPKFGVCAIVILTGDVTLSGRGFLIKKRLEDIKYLKIYLRAYRSSILFNLILMVVLSILSVVPPYLLKVIVDDGIIARNVEILIYCSLAVAGFYLVYAVLNYISSYKFTVMSEFIVLDIKKDLFRRIMTFPLAFFTRQEKGYILARVNEVNAMKSLFSSTTFKFILSIGEFVLAAVILFQLNVKLTLISFLFLPVYYILIKRMMGQINSIIKKTMEESARASGTIQQVINGITEIKLFNKEKDEGNKIDAINEKLTKLTVRQGIVINFTTEAVNLIGSMMTIAVLMLSGIYIIQDNMTIGTYFAFSGYLPKLLTPVQTLSMSFMGLQPGWNALRRVGSFFQKYQTGKEDTGKIEVHSLKGHIEIHSLTFRHEDMNEDLFKNINLIIKPGDKVLIRGRNGSGKSTLLKLLLGIYEHYEGEIRVDGYDLRQLNKATLRERAGIVSQDIFLFNGTIKDNVLYSIHDVCDDDVAAALKISGLNEMCKSLPMGIYTNVGENGSLLSGGQKQMIAIARAVIKKPDLYIFDEATTNLDQTSKAMITRMVEQELVGKTCIFVSHENSADISFNRYIDLDLPEKVVV